MISNIQKKHQLVKTNGIEYYTIEGMDAVHAEMLRLLKIVDKIARENEIPYWIAGGSMIGVARHHGFIPWDDDLDIELLKPDYLRLIECLTDYSKTHDDAFIFFPAPQEIHCCNYFASNKCFLRSQGSPSVYPAKVDIRPYNCIQNTKEAIEENQKLQDIANFLVFGKSYGVVDNIELAKVHSSSFFKKYNLEYGLYNPTLDDAILMPPYYEYSMKFKFKYNHLFPLNNSGFEDMQTYMPKEYDYILKSIYGDYMKLPQLHHRVPAACQAYMKTIPVSKLKSFYSRSFDGSIAGKIRKALFLVQFHGLFNFLKCFLLEKTVHIDSNYEDAINNW